MTARRALVALGLAACGGPSDPPDAQLGGVHVTGVVRYEDRAPQSTALLGAPTPVAARGVAVALVTLGGVTLGESTTTDDGTFTIDTTIDVPYGDSVHILAATVSDATNRVVSVVRPDGNIHGFGAPGFEAAAQANIEVLVTESSDEAGAFNVFDRLIAAVDYVDSIGQVPESLTAIWARGNADGTYYISADNTMHLLGLADDDGYDDTVILHEAGHWAEDTIGRSDNPGGDHDGTPTDPNLAWSEGFATYFGVMTNAGGPVYIDTALGGGFSYDIDDQVTAMPNGGAAGPAGDISEDTISEVLWDLGDAPAADDDGFVGTDPAVLGVQPDYLRTATLRGLGEPGVDLLDFLDGFFVADGLTHCDLVRAIVTTARDFPYDYAGPAGACP